MTEEEGSTGFELLVAGFAIGVVSVFIVLVLFHPEPFFIDCGCSAQSSMAKACFDSGNLSSWQCGVFK